MGSLLGYTIALSLYGSLHYSVTAHSVLTIIFSKCGQVRRFVHLLLPISVIGILIENPANCRSVHS